MFCPFCNSFKSEVSSTKNSGYFIRRYRYCRKCGKYFATIEKPIIPKDSDIKALKEFSEISENLIKGAKNG